MALDAKGVASVLVGHQKQNIRAFHRWSFAARMADRKKRS
jgi:hypothetical protein